MKLINNIHDSLENELRNDLRDGSRVAIAAAGFSMYAYRELREALSKCKEFRFIFTEPTFSAAEDIKEDKEFVISRRIREKGIYGNAYELPSPNAKELEGIFKRICKDNNILSTPDECFRYMQELPDKYRQMSIFDM